MNDSDNTKEFFPIWKKYRPVILKLMIDSLEGGVQEYNLSKHEFTDVNTKKSTTYSFKMEAFEGRATYAKKPITVGTDFLAMLKSSGRAIELMNTATFSFELDAQFHFKVSAVKAEAPAADEDE